MYKTFKNVYSKKKNKNGLIFIYERVLQPWSVDQVKYNIILKISDNCFFFMEKWKLDMNSSRERKLFRMEKKEKKKRRKALEWLFKC